MTFQTPESPARPPAIAWIHDEVTCGTEASFRELVGGVPTAMLDRAVYGRVCLPARLADTDLTGEPTRVLRSAHAKWMDGEDGPQRHPDLWPAYDDWRSRCVVVDDLVDDRPAPPRGTRAQRRRTATARVQARRRKARAAVAAMRLYLGEWFQARIQKRLDALVGAAYPGVDSVPAGLYDPPRSMWGSVAWEGNVPNHVVLLPGYTAEVVVPYV